MARAPEIVACVRCNVPVISTRGPKGERIYLDTTAQVWVQVPNACSAVPAAYAQALALGVNAHVVHALVCSRRER